MEVRFVTHEAAVVVGNTLIIADVHIGVEHSLWRKGLQVPTGTERIRQRIEKIVSQEHVEEIIVLGDVKDKVPGISFQERREVPHAFAGIGVSVIVAPGNHDPGLQEMVEGIKVMSSRGFSHTTTEGNIYATHGHTWPLKKAFSCKALFMGHVHPAIELVDGLGKRWLEPVWFQASFLREPLEEKYGTVPKKLPDVIGVPAFNNLVGGRGLNVQKEVRGPLMNCLDMKEADVTLVDGTYLGKLKDITTANV